MQNFSSLALNLRNCTVDLVSGGLGWGKGESVAWEGEVFFSAQKIPIYLILQTKFCWKVASVLSEEIEIKFEGQMKFGMGDNLTTIFFQVYKTYSFQRVMLNSSSFHSFY